MAVQKTDAAALTETLAGEASKGIFHPVYVLMGAEPYYPDLVCRAILENCIDDSSKDFNETVCYGADVTAERIITEAREFPMMSDRRLVVVREAQMMTDIENLSVYCSSPLDSTVLVLLFRGASLDKRKGLYKAVQKNGVILDSPALRDYQMPSWIQRLYSSKGLSIDPDAAALLAESAGTDLGTVAVETDKLIRNLPEGTVRVSVADIENNVGISRQYSVFELTGALSYRKVADALRVAAHLGSSAKFAMPMAVSVLYTHFSRILRYDALLLKTRNPSDGDKARALQGASPYFYREYEAAARNYPLAKCMAVISLLSEYDYLGKGGDGGLSTPDQLLTELVLKILNV